MFEAGGVWEFYDPELQVKSGDRISYKVTAFYDNDVTEESEWMSRKFSCQYLNWRVGGGYIVYYIRGYGVKVVVFNATFNNISVISWRSFLLVKEPGVPGENHLPPADS